MSAKPFKIMPLSDEDRVRRTAILCCHCLRSIAFYRAGWRSRELRVQGQFWIAANGAFMDLAIVDWCKLFADPKGQHFWSKAVADEARFADALNRRLRHTASEFAAYIQTFKHPRDKFIAHLDAEDTMYLPRLRKARASAAFLYDDLLTAPSTARWFRHDPRPAARDFYRTCYSVAVDEYRRAVRP